jgi:hypothetical protein
MERFSGMKAAKLGKMLSRAGSWDGPGAKEHAVFLSISW